MILVAGGHHAKAKGAVHNGHGEYPRTYTWATKIVALLKEKYNLEAELCPSGPLPEKIAYINTRGKLCTAVEIHFNSAPSGNAHGSESLYYPNSREGQYLAECIQKHLGQVSKPDRGIKEGWYRQDYPNRKDYDGDVEGDETPLYFLKKTACPAVVVEPAFIQDEQFIDGHDDEMCEAIARGIYEFQRE